MIQVDELWEKDNHIFIWSILPKLLPIIAIVWDLAYLAGWQMSPNDLVWTFYGKQIKQLHIFIILSEQS